MQNLFNIVQKRGKKTIMKCKHEMCKLKYLYNTVLFNVIFALLTESEYVLSMDK